MLKLPGIYPQPSTQRLCASQNVTQGLRKLKGLKGFKKHLSQVRHSLQCCQNWMVIKAFRVSKVALIYLRGGKLLAWVSHFLPFAWKKPPVCKQNLSWTAPDWTEAAADIEQPISWKELCHWDVLVKHCGPNTSISALGGEGAVIPAVA